jgi:hypothetical protein
MPNEPLPFTRNLVVLAAITLAIGGTFTGRVLYSCYRQLEPVRACEAGIQRWLRSPSTYRRVSYDVDIRTRPFEPERWRRMHHTRIEHAVAAMTGLPIDPDSAPRRDPEMDAQAADIAASPEGAHLTEASVTIEYEAANAYGTLVQRRDYCDLFEVTYGNAAPRFDVDDLHALTIAPVGNLPSEAYGRSGQRYWSASATRRLPGASAPAS